MAYNLDQVPEYMFTELVLSVLCMFPVKIHSCLTPPFHYMYQKMAKTSSFFLDVNWTCLLDVLNGTKMN